MRQTSRFLRGSIATAFPMGSFHQIEPIFHEALAISDPAKRAAWLNRRCAADPWLLAEVSSLLSAHFAMAARPEPVQVSSDPAIPSEQFGVYRLVRLVGRGGMSAVYQAERVDGQFEKRVAVKVMAAHLAGDEFLKRFHTEAQFLASLQHPNIPALLDGGVSPSGHPYLVVEYVEGEPLDRYCDDRKLPVEARLRLFLEVCQAVEHAHRNLILHRDLKPANVFVTPGGAVKLLDFGTAALMQEGPNVTVTRARMLTPRYASPEQLRGERPGVTGDVFSLGVILYELLTGAWPFGDPDSVMSGLRRAAGHATATQPSTAVTNEAPALRSLSPERLRALLSGDLSAILLKALENDPARRYSTVANLAGDVLRFLEGRPVEAHPQTFLYRSGKFVARHWFAVTAAAVFVLGLSASTVLAVRQAQVARAEAAKARDEAEKAARVTRFLRSMLTSGFKAGGADVTVIQMLNAAEPGIEASWKNDPLAEATLRESLGASYVTLERLDRAKTQLDRALALFEKLGRHVDAADTLLVLGIAAQRAESDTAAGYYQRALDELQRAGKDAPPALLFRVKVYLAGVLSAGLHRLTEAAALLDQALALAAREPAIPRDQLPAAWTHRGEIFLEQGQFDQAEALFQNAIAADRNTFDAWMGMARSSFLKQNFAAAADFARRNYEITAEFNHANLADTAEAAMEWAKYRAEAGEPAEALKQIRGAMPEVQKMYKAGLMRARYFQDAAPVFNRAALFDEAEQSARQALDALHEGHIPETHPVYAASYEDLGVSLAGKKRYRDAIPALEKSVEIHRSLGPAYAQVLVHAEAILSDAKQHAAEQ
ncbi:MAG TPA: protein kinase [Bryobacteraceae bacterium]|nr:protein kinase [Bryobacteraceae bacterium]